MSEDLMNDDDYIFDLLPDGTKIWKKHEGYHRLDGPAIIYPNGRQEWWQNGMRHRVGAPAVVHGIHELWYQNDLLHRMDGPAELLCSWYVRDRRIDEELIEWLEETTSGQYTIADWREWPETVWVHFRMRF